MDQEYLDACTAKSGNGLDAASTLKLVDGRFWVKRGCVAVAWGTFRQEHLLQSGGVLARLSARFKVLHRTFSLRDGRGLLTAEGMRIMELSAVGDTPITVRLDRLIAFSEGLRFSTRFIRRIPMTGTGGWHTAQLSGEGQVLIAAVGDVQCIHSNASVADEADFEPESVLAWRGNIAPRFALQRLTWTAILSPQGYRESRMTLPDFTSVWVDSSARPLTAARLQAMMRRGANGADRKP